jgi:cytoskeletal protein CcmA (bactofilin family)
VFGKRPKPPAAVPTDITIIAAGSAVEGKLLIRGAVRVDGAVNGAVVADGSVVIGPEGKVLGEVEADDLTVAGRVDGIVRVRGHLRVQATGAVQGHARYTTLEVERGGVMDGSTTHLVEGASTATPANDVEVLSMADVVAAE